MKTSARWLALALVTVGCDEGCWWTDAPDPLPTMRLGTPYPTQDARFDVTLHAVDDMWPPGVEPFALELQFTPRGDDTVENLEVGAPALVDGELVAEQWPDVTPIDDERWRLDPLVLDAPGVWEVPLDVRTPGPDGDRFALRLAVEQ